MPECHVAELRTRWRAKASDRPQRDLLRQLENCRRGQLRIAGPRGLDFGPPGYYGPLRGIASSPLPAQ